MYDINEELFDFISESPTAFQGTENASRILKFSGYEYLPEGEVWSLEKGGKYYTTRNRSSLIAFRIPEGSFTGMMITAAHLDSPAFKIKENAELKGGAYVKLSTEKYGGMLMAPWLDRPLSIAGRIIVKTPDGFETRLVDFKKPCAVIPNLAIHMNRSANDGTKYNPAVDMLPVYCTDEGLSVKEMCAKLCEIAVDSILSTDLFLYCAEKGTLWGDYISAPRLDDLQCAYATLSGFLSASEAESIPVLCLFDNEEVGSGTRQGADSTFLTDTVSRISESLSLSGQKEKAMIANSFMLSCDNAHAVHPNHGEYKDENHSVFMNKGIVIKYNAAQHYASDGISSSFFKMICEEAGVPYQLYANRADVAGGGTLGNISGSHLSVPTADIGLPQLAMHSAYETAGKADTEYMVKACRVFFSKSIVSEKDGCCRIK